MEKLIEIFTEMLNHIDNHNYAYKKPQWTNRQIVETWVKTNESKLKNIGDIASVSKIPNGVLAKNKCEEIMQELDNLVVNKDHLPVFKNYFELGFEKCYNWIRVSSR